MYTISVCTLGLSTTGNICCVKECFDYQEVVRIVATLRRGEADCVLRRASRVVEAVDLVTGGAAADEAELSDQFIDGDSVEDRQPDALIAGRVATDVAGRRSRLARLRGKPSFDELVGPRPR